MNILLNGQPRTVADDCTIAELLQAEGLQDRRLAIEINLNIVPRQQHASHHLHSGDRVEIVQAMGGG